MAREGKLLLLTSRELYQAWKNLRDNQEVYSSRLRDALDKSVRDTRRKMVGAVLIDAIEGGGIDSASWQVAAGDLLVRGVRELTRPHVRDAIVTGMRSSTAEDRARALGVVLDIPKERLDQFSDEYSSRVAWYLNDSSRKGTEQFVDKSLAKGRHPGLIGRVVRRLTLMSPQQAISTDAFIDSLLKNTKDQRVLTARLFPYLDRQLEQRLNAFAETESMTAINFGQQIAFEEAVKRGDIPETSLKVWVTATDERVCPICKPMDGQKVPLLGKFTTKVGEVVVPPVHPNCRCTIVPEEFLGSLGEVRARLRSRAA